MIAFDYVTYYIARNLVIGIISCLVVRLCDQMDNPLDTIAAQGAFRGFTIGVATIFGIPLGTILVLVNGPRYAFGISLIANFIAFAITLKSDVPDIMSLHYKKEKQESARVLQLTDLDMSDSSFMVCVHLLY